MLTNLPTIGALHDELTQVLAGDRGGARDLIAALLDQPRFWPTAHRDASVDDGLGAAARRAAASMRQGMPFAYAVGKAAFRSLTLQVDRRVLIPRPETELLVEMALTATGRRGRIADIGTGSGAIALALAAEGDYEAVIATDISADALEVARANLAAIPADRHGRVVFRQGDLLDAIAGESVTAIVSNPPYIANAEGADLPASVRDWEPAGALFSGDDGMTATARLISGAATVLNPGGLLLIEIDSRRGGASRHLAESDGRWSDVQVRLDFTGRDRFLVARRT